MTAREHGGECPDCLRVARLLMPVAIYPGMNERQVIRLCLDCRTGFEPSQWCCLASDIDHSVTRQWRAGVGGGVPERWIELTKAMPELLVR